MGRKCSWQGCVGGEFAGGGPGNKHFKRWALGDGIPAPHVGSADGKGARVDNSEDGANTKECISSTQVQHHQMHAHAHSTPMMPPNHQPGPQFVSMFPYNLFLGLGEHACNGVEQISSEV